MKNGHADWLGWTFQFICGLVVGILFGLASIARRYSGWAINSHVVVLFISGAGLIGGALASQYGDRLWIKNFNKFVFPDDSDIQQSNFSRLSSILIGITGAGMMIYAILVTLKVI